MINNVFVSNKKVTTPRIMVFLFCLGLIFCPYLLTWLLVGEFDLLNVNWLMFAFNNNPYVFNLNILYIFIGIILLTIIAFSILKYVFKLVNWDCLPFLIMTHVICITTITSGLISYTKDNLTYIIIARFVMVIVAGLISFFLFNFIANKIMLSSIDAFNFFVAFKKNKEKQDELSKANDIFKNDNEKDYIEVEKE